jgi:hypothetical protein
MTDDRDVGLDFGDLREDLAAESFPLSKDDLLEEYGDRDIGTESGSTTLREILEPVGEETFEDVDAVRQTVLTMVDESAEGRPHYSDRGPSQDESEQQSF